ncbi:BNR-4 repeat-containing protein [Novipirellula artificiosorum]|nr:BNR-4 repeat-containing protein [Novipirellula artificiosorum]
MIHINRFLVPLFWCLLFTAQATSVLDAEGFDDDTMDVAIGGCGGVYLLASPGELVIDVYKRDRNRGGRTTELRAILVGPDRQVLQEAVIPDDEKPAGHGWGEAQHVRFTTTVSRKGIFALNITVSQDRYGSEMAWGFQTNCKKYMVETSRGHRDERRQEPIVLLNPSRAGDVCFVPREGKFDMEISGLSNTAGELSVFDGNDELIQTLAVDSQGKTTHSFPAQTHRDALPWRLHLPSYQATIQIDGVTRWDSTDPYVNLPCWTPDPTSYFSLLPYRWLLTPYRTTIHAPPGEQRQTRFRLHNNGSSPTTIELNLEFDDQNWPVELSSQQVQLAPRQAAEVTATYCVPTDGEAKVCHIRATPTDCPELSTYSTLRVTAEPPLASQPLEMPIVLKPYQHENELYGYQRDYPSENQMYFDVENRPCLQQDGEIATLGDEHWTQSDLSSAIEYCDPQLKGQSIKAASTKIAFDSSNGMYVLARAGGQAVLLHSVNRGRTFSAYAIPGPEKQASVLDMEQFSGHNVSDQPPAIVRFTRTATDSKLKWRRLNDLELILPKKNNGRITFDHSVLISKSCIGLSSHSGIPSSVVSRGDKVHVAWGQATDPAEQVPGVPAYVVTFDRRTGQLGKPALVGYGPPANDVHNSPSITMDSRGTLHVLCGTHGQPFPYSRSLATNDASLGWTDPVTVGDGRQTYVGLVCGADDTLHLVFRMWRQGEQPHPASHHATLAYQRKPPGQPWEAPRVLIVAPFSEYSIFYHRLTIDRKGRLFLSYDYWSTYWFYRTDHQGDRRAVIMSPNRGTTWKLVETSDL